MLERTIATALIATGLAGCCFGGQTPTGSVPPIPGVGAVPAIPTPPVVPTLAPGAVSLTPGFIPDPQVVAGMAGGPADATGMNASCRGYVSAQPNHVLNATAPFSNLRILVSSTQDTTLVVQMPNGTFACNDDTEGYNPIVQGPMPAGTYRIWVGTYTQGAAAPYSIGFSELSSVTAATLGAPNVAPTGPVGAAGIPQDCAQTVPNYGPITVGSTVVLGAHQPYVGAGPNGIALPDDQRVNWDASMQPFVGQRTQVTALGQVDQAGCPGVRVAADNGGHFWRIRNMSL